MAALCEQETNWCVPQTSAHADVWYCLREKVTNLAQLHKLDRKPRNAFDYYSNIARNQFAGRRHQVCTLLALESVISLLWEWQMATMQEIEREIDVSLECFDFNTHVNILDGCCGKELL